MRRGLLIGFISVTIGLNSCQDETIIPAITNPVPVLRFLSIEPKTVREFTDSIVIMLEYSDQDGDLGHDDADIRALEIRDLRLENPDFQFIPPLSPPGAVIPIKGTLRVVVRNTFLLGTGNLEPTSYELRIRDRAYHWSNPVQTDPIQITR